MPKIAANGADKANDLSDQLLSFFQGIEHTSQPVVIAGVQRKVNIGNFENVDVYCAAAMPVDISGCVTEEDIAQLLEAKLDDILHLTSKKTAEKYNLVKGPQE